MVNCFQRKIVCFLFKFKFHETQQKNIVQKNLNSIIVQWALEICCGWWRERKREIFLWITKMLENLCIGQIRNLNYCLTHIGSVCGTFLTNRNCKKWKHLAEEIERKSWKIAKKIRKRKIEKKNKKNDYYDFFLTAIKSISTKVWQQKNECESIS